METGPPRHGLTVPVLRGATRVREATSAYRHCSLDGRPGTTCIASLSTGNGYLNSRAGRNGYVSLLLPYRAGFPRVDTGWIETDVIADRTAERAFRSVRLWPALVDGDRYVGEPRRHC